MKKQLVLLVTFEKAAVVYFIIPRKLLIDNQLIVIPYPI